MCHHHTQSHSGECVYVVLYLMFPPGSAVCVRVAPWRSSAAADWDRASFSPVCELIFYELRVRFELNGDLDVHSSPSLFIPQPWCHTSLTHLYVLIPHSLRNSKPGYALGVCACARVCVLVRDSGLWQDAVSHLSAVDVECDFLCWGEVMPLLINYAWNIKKTPSNMNY